MARKIIAGLEEAVSLTNTEQALNILRDARTALERTRGEEHEAIERALEKVREAEMMLEEVLRG